jgi:multidrug efflux pump subunit AcrA (membrane-fusion protein)
VAVSVAARDKFKTTILIREIDIHRIQVGMPATVQVTAINGTLFPAKVTDISPTATVQSGVVNYKVVIDLLSPQNTASSLSTQPFSQGINSASPVPEVSKQPPASTSQLSQLRDGFTATIKILIEEKKDVVLVPNRAIISEGRATSVEVIKNGTPERRPVITGSSDNQFTEITKGLVEGEQVLIQQLKTTTPTTPRQLPGDFRRMIR